LPVREFRQEQIMPDTPAPPKNFTISPATADVNSNAVCQFTVDPPGTAVKWNIKPNIGSIDDNGVYSSPEQVKIPQTVIAIATAASGESATASINLTDAPASILWLAWYGIVVAILLGIGILAGWNYLYQAPPVPLVIVNPPVVTLDPTHDTSFPFTATVLGDNKGAVTWSVSGGGEIDSTGAFHPRDAAGQGAHVVTVTAKAAGDDGHFGSAIVNLTPGKHLEVTPQGVSLFPSQQVQFRTPNANVKWSLGRNDAGSISPDGVFTAGGTNTATSVVQVSAWGATPDERAAAAVVINRPSRGPNASSWPLLFFVIICGSLGSMIYYTSSFVNFVGNRTFRSSWFWFYISRPFVGGGLAVIFFFLAGAGLLNSTSGPQVMQLGLLSALVGLFSDKAVKKLSDVLDVLLATKDDRKDKVSESNSLAAAAPAKPAAPPPRIDSITPASLAPNTSATIDVKGSGFKTGCKVKVNGQDAAPTDQMEQNFKLAIAGAQAQPPKITIEVTTDQGTASIDVPVK
jgi:hypothetical protein